MHPVNRHPVRETDQETRYVYRRNLDESTFPNAFLYCPECGGRWSATSGDYFWKPDDEPFMCDDCEMPLSLVLEISRLVTLDGEEV